MLLAGQLVPQRVVAAGDLLGHLDRVDVGRQQPAGLQVEQLAADPLEGKLDVVRALAVGQRRVQLGGLGVDQVGGERAGVEPEQRVRQRAVAPHEAGQVQPGQQLDHRVEQLVGRLPAARVGEQRPVGDRVVEEPGDQHGVEVAGPVDHDAEHLDRGDAELVPARAAAGTRAGPAARRAP